MHYYDNKVFNIYIRKKNRHIDINNSASLNFSKLTT